jgi:hypothetical protein
MAAGLVLCACSEKRSEEDSTIDTTVEETPGLDVPTGGYARVIPNTTFEGLTWFVTGLQHQTDSGPDLTGAVVSMDTFADEVIIREQRCNRMRCAVVLEVTEFMEPTGQPIPPPITAQNVMLRIDPPSGEWMIGTLSVFPLDYTDHFTDTMPLRFKGTYMMSSFRMTAGTTMEVNPADLIESGRLFVAGPIELAGSILLGGADAEGTIPGTQGLGGGEGGGTGAAGAGPGAGTQGLSGGGGGGGSHGGLGTDGADGAGTGGTAGSGYGEINVECLIDPEAEQCGGSGGGGSTGAAGAGGGSALLMASCESITFDGGLIDVSGGDGAAGAAGGGGGSGGALGLIAPTISGTGTLDLTGGAGGAGSGGGDGGAGGAGRLRLDGEMSGADLTIQPNFHFPGPVIDRSTLELLDDDGHITVTGWASPGAQLRIAVDNRSGFADMNFDTIATAESTFTIEVTLNPGISLLTLSQNLDDVVSFGQVGNTFEVAATAVRGTLLYVASVPDTE